MRATILLSIAVLATALAGCSDPPPSGEFSSDGSAATAAGPVESAEFTEFQPAYEQTSGQDVDQCPTQDVDDPTNQIVSKCTYASTVIHANLTDLPDPQGDTFSIYFMDSSGTNPVEEAGALENVHEMGGVWMGEFHFDNRSECEGEEGEAANEMCKKDEKFDTLQLRLGDVPLASADMSTGSSFTVLGIHQAVSFDGSFSGSDFTVSVSGLDSNLTYTAWLITEDDAGAAVHEESFAVSSGENTYEAGMDGDEYVAFHIHVTGTKINVAVGALA